MNEDRYEAIERHFCRFKLPPDEESWARLARKVLATWHPPSEWAEEKVRDVLVELVRRLAAEKWEKPFRARRTSSDAIDDLAAWWAKRHATSAVPCAIIIARIKKLERKKKAALLLHVAAGLAIEQVASITKREARDVEADVRSTLAKMAQNGTGVARGTNAVAHQGP